MLKSTYPSNEVTLACCAILFALIGWPCSIRATNRSAETADKEVFSCPPDSGFSYRSIYSPTGLNAATSAELGLNNFDADWGIWGHNLKKAVDADDNEELDATVDGYKVPEQLCFSSRELYRRTVEYITDNFDDHHSIRIVIGPTDYPDACTCHNCVQLGNTPHNGTPAVAHFAEQLSKRFPVHQFFILSYLSTEQPPAHALPQNVGVIISAMPLPFSLTDKAPDPHNLFVQQLTKWKRVVKHLYVWDYINNFDDYLTPLPLLKILRQRLLYYKAQQVEGLFLNGSGYLYATFDDLKTAVLAGLMRNPNRSVEELAKAFLQKAYPVSCEWIYQYYMELENRLPRNEPFDLYMGSDRLKQLNSSAGSKLYDFYNGLNTYIAQAKGQERKNLQQLHAALAFPLLEMARMYNIHATLRCEAARKELHKAVAAGTILYYNEAEQTVHDYLTEWERYMPPSEITHNLLSGIIPQVTMYNHKEEVLHPAELLTLTDATHGFPGNYHCGWVIFPTDSVSLDFSVSDLTDSGTLKLSFLQMTRHHIVPPDEMEIYKNDTLYQKVSFASFDKEEEVSSDGRSRMIKTSIPFSMDGATRLTIRLTSSTKGRQIAVDEIAFIK
jgi:hypothetical protein